MRDFSKKIVYITGGSSGIGLAAAELLSERGAHVAVFARNQGRLDAAVSAITAKSPVAGRFSGFATDVSDNAQVRQVMDSAVSAFGPPDVLINCAGRARPGRFSDISFAMFDETIKTNLYGIWNTVSALVPVMKPGAYIVNTSSVAGFIGVFGYTDYSASKFAVIGFSEALRSELAPSGITVSVLCPPDTDTPGFVEENKTKPDETKMISKSASIMSARQVAEALVAGMAKEKFMIVPGMDGKLSFLAKRLAPWLVERHMAGIIRKAGKK
jgi:NAD(P)-dependent dehydrogenase (short-subunit alcohol dehydrogenase family)